MDRDVRNIQKYMHHHVLAAKIFSDVIPEISLLYTIITDSLSKLYAVALVKQTSFSRGNCISQLYLPCSQKIRTKTNKIPITKTNVYMMIITLNLLSKDYIRLTGKKLKDAKILMKHISYFSKSLFLLMTIFF